MGIKQLYYEINQTAKNAEENIEDMVNDLTTQAQREIADKGDEAEDDMDLGIEMINDQEVE